MRRFRGHRDDGSQLIETAFSLPLLVVIAFGIVQFGMALNRSQGINAVAREAARMVSIEDTPVSASQVRAVASLPNFVDPNDVALELTRVLTWGDGTQTSHTWSWDPVTATWSGGSPSDIPCSDAVRPETYPPIDADEVERAVVIAELELLNPQDYGVNVPLLGSFDMSHASLAEYPCEY